MSTFTVVLQLADITSVKADSCVSSVHRSGDMGKGPLAAHVRDKAGPTVQEELIQTKGPKKLSHGQVVTTAPGQLGTNFKFLYFVCLYSWRPKNDETLCRAVFKCLELASQAGLASIALPALGMGGQKYPAYNVARAIMIAFLEFIRNNPKTTLRTVHIALKDRDLNSVNTFLQTTSAFMEGVAQGMQMDPATNLIFQGAPSSENLESKHPVRPGVPGTPCQKTPLLSNVTYDTKFNLKDLSLGGSVTFSINAAELIPARLRTPLSFIGRVFGL